MGKYKCPFCSAKSTLVKETRAEIPFKRIRFCPKCEERFQTIEVHLESDSEDYLNLVSRMSTEKLLERMMKVFNSKRTQTVLNEQLKKQAGIRQGKITNPAELFQ